jgi:hypothetical protein
MSLPPLPHSLRVLKADVHFAREMPCQRIFHIDRPRKTATNTAHAICAVLARHRVVGTIERAPSTVVEIELDDNG